MPRMVNLLAVVAALAIGAQANPVPVKPCHVSEKAQPLRLRDSSNPARCIVETHPQPKDTPFETAVEWGPCGMDNADALLFTWNATDLGNFAVLKDTKLCLGKDKDSAAVGLLKCEFVKEEKKISKAALARQNWLINDKDNADHWQLAGDCSKCLDAHKTTKVEMRKCETAKAVIFGGCNPVTEQCGNGPYYCEPAPPKCPVCPLPLTCGGVECKPECKCVVQCGRPTCVCPCPPPSDKCDNVKCPANSVCVNGKCYCEEGFQWNEDKTECVLPPKEPIDCKVVCDKWSNCDDECKQTRKCEIVQYPANGGKQCKPEDLIVERDCVGCTPVKPECTWNCTAWADPTPKPPCGDYQQTRTCTKHNPGNAVCPPKPAETQTVKQDACEVTPCTWTCTAWKDPTPKPPCDDYEQTRTCTKNNPDNAECPDKPAETQTVPQAACPVQPGDCEYTWGDYSECSKTCGEGTKWRQCTITTPATGGTCKCDPNKKYYTSCNLGDCPAPSNCQFTWSNWGQCSKPCDGGVQERKCTITQAATNGGTCACDESKTYTQSCNTGPCPVNKPCVSSWSAWSQCSATCGGGSRTRTCTITTPPQGSGTCDCNPNVPETQACNTQSCNPCEVAGGFCSHSCGNNGNKESAECNTQCGCQDNCNNANSLPGQGDHINQYCKAQGNLLNNGWNVCCRCKGPSSTCKNTLSL